MLGELHVRGVGGIRSAILELSGGLIAVTGESGAGKSSLVRSLEFLSGHRGQSSLIRAGCEEAEVEAQFVLDVPPEGDLDPSFDPQDGAWIVRRSLSRSGRGRCLIQGKLAPVSLLGRAMGRILSIQSQFAQLALLSPEEQREQLDACGGEPLAEVKRELARALSDAIASERRIRELEVRRRELEKKYEGAEATLAYASRLGLHPGCEEEWEGELREIEALRHRRETLRGVVARLRGAGMEPGLVDELSSLLRTALPQIPEEDREARRGEFDLLLRAMEETAQGLQEVHRGLSDGREDPGEELERKLGALRKLKRATRTSSVEELTDYLARAGDDMAWVRQSGGEIEGERAVAEARRKELAGLTLALRRRRREVAGELASKVERRLDALGMEGIRFLVQLVPQEKVRAFGADGVSFQIATKDLPPLPIQKVASGGELSRILLALEISLPDALLPSVLVFDEVEAGLGGRSALLAGLLLKELSACRQVILVTHEASIAALADRHFMVLREGEETRIVQVRGEVRVREIARMLSGSGDEPEAQEHARTLLRRSSPSLG